MNHLGAMAAVLIYVMCIMIFAVRLIKMPRIGYWIGGVLIMMIFPLGHLLITAPKLGRPTLYYVQIGLMIVYLVVELILDYILEYNFRQVRWMVISYVTLFFAATGGMLGVASKAGPGYMLISIVLYLIMGALAFYQRAVTGM
jgi:hypothetical protein